MVFSSNDGGFEAAGSSVRPQFHGTAGTMFPMVLKGLFLTAITLGIYRFWYQTEVRRFLWNNTEVDGDVLEYTGRGVELFIGFLIALAVLIPFYGLVFLGAAVAGPIGGAIIQSVLTIGLLFLAQYALFRARRYRLTRTIWRGVRFQQTGSGWAYAGKSFGWGLLTLVTLGLTYPLMRASLERYKMTNTWYGDQKGEFSATAGQLFKKGFLIWLIGIVLVLGPVGLAVAAAATSPGHGGGLSAIHGVITLAIPAIVLLIPLYQAIEFRWWANGCSVGPATVRCDLGLGAFLKVYLGYLGVVILFLIALSIVGGVIGGIAYASGLFVKGQEPGALGFVAIALAIVAYVLVLLCFAALTQLFIIRPTWRKSFESVEIAGLGSLMAAQSTTPEANAFGEGIADAIDFGGF